MQLTGSPQTIEIPCFQSFRANLTLPKNNGGGSSPLHVRLESSTDKSLGAPSPAPGTGKPRFYESIKADNDLTLYGTTVTADISSESEVKPGHTYAANVFLAGSMLVPTITGLVPSGHNLYITISVPLDTTLPGGTPLQIVLYESS